MTTSNAGSSHMGSEGRSINQLLALVFGAVYSLIGIVGFFVTNGAFFATNTNDKLLGIFEVNQFHNLLHLLIGLALLAASRRLDTARGANLAIGLTYLLVGIVGFFVVDTEANIMSLNTADHFLHLGSAALLAGAALFADKTMRSRV